jgi:DNA-directed RNA polymerase specialized sigma24 family protein
MYDRGELRGFRTTHWSLVLLAGQGGSAQSDEALERLCRAYWSPLYAYIRWRGYTEHDAKDLTQGFFAQLLQKKYLASLQFGKGRFRSFLLAALNNYLANEWDRSNRIKRGGGCSFISFDDQEADEFGALEPTDPQSAERIFERRWAEAVIQQTLEKLEAEFGGKRERFDQLKVFLVEEKGASSYAEAAASMALSEQAVKSAVHRMRERYRELFRAEIANTVTSHEEIEQEMRHLLAALSD